jgi:hypothetical protein
MVEAENVNLKILLNFWLLIQSDTRYDGMMYHNCAVPLRIRSTKSLPSISESNVEKLFAAIT